MTDWNETDAAIFSYIVTLAKREEKSYATAFAHALITHHGDSEAAVLDTLNHRQGVTARRAEIIRRDLIQRGIC